MRQCIVQLRFLIDRLAGKLCIANARLVHHQQASTDMNVRGIYRTKWFRLGVILLRS